MKNTLKIIAICAATLSLQACSSLSGAVVGGASQQYFGKLSVTGEAKENKDSGARFVISGEFPAQPVNGQKINATFADGRQCSIEVTDARYSQSGIGHMMKPDSVYGMVYMDCQDRGKGYLPYVINHSAEKGYTGFIDGDMGKMRVNMRLKSDLQ